MSRFPKPKTFGPKEFADRARKIVRKYANAVNGDSSVDDDETYVLDFLTDLRHFCKEEKINFAKCLRISRGHCTAEEDECTNTSQSPT